LSNFGVRKRQPCLRLRNVGTCHETDIEALLRGLELLAEHVDIALPESQYLTITDDIHIGLGRLEQDILFHREKVLTACLDIGLAALHSIFGCKAAEDRLGQGDLKRAWVSSL